MYKVIVGVGATHGMSIKSVSFQTKEEAMVFITIQLNKILNNPNVKRWDMSM